MGKGIKIGIAGAGVLAACFVGDKFVKWQAGPDMPKYTVNDVAKFVLACPQGGATVSNAPENTLLVSCPSGTPSVAKPMNNSVPNIVIPVTGELSPIGRIAYQFGVSPGVEVDKSTVTPTTVVLTASTAGYTFNHISQ